MNLLATEAGKCADSAPVQQPLPIRGIPIEPGLDRLRGLQHIAPIPRPRSLSVPVFGNVT